MKKMLMCAAVAGTALLGLAAATVAQGTRENSADQEFVSKAAVGGSTEVALGKLAVERGATEEVKRFGQQMVTDHTQANNELLALAARKQIQVPKVIDSKHQDALDRIAKQTGTDFDRQFSEQMVKDHKETIQLFETEAKNGQDADLKAFASRTLPTLQHHLKMAQDLWGEQKDRGPNKNVGSKDKDKSDQNDKK